MIDKLFHYTDGGLKNVWLANGFEIRESPYGKTVAFHNLDGLTQAMKSALAEARWDLTETCYRIADLSGEQYYFKEASLALSRAIRYRKDDFELWHPAECMGEAGAASAMACLVAAYAAAAKQYAPARQAILHFSNDEGARAVVLTCTT